MSTERKSFRPEDAYGLTAHEVLYDRISHERFMALIQAIETVVHQLQVSANNYGEFLFVTTSRTIGDERYRLTFWGLGYHEYRERWLSQEWFWYQGTENAVRDEQHISKDAALEQIEARRQALPSLSEPEPQSKRGKLFEFLADLTDEDGAYSELEDLSHLLDDFDDLLDR